MKDKIKELGTVVLLYIVFLASLGLLLEGVEEWITVACRYIAGITGVVYYGYILIVYYKNRPEKENPYEKWDED